jgi:hypothetical protein
MKYILTFTPLGLLLLYPLIALCIIRLLFRRDVVRIMSENLFVEPTFAVVNQALAAVNARSRTYIFNVERTTNILFRGHRLCLVAGPVRRVGVGKFVSTLFFNKRLYALADDQQVDWMKANPDVFSAACLASPYSVFWIKLAALKTTERDR